MSAMEAKSLVSLTNITAIKGKLEKDLVIFQIKCTLYFLQSVLLQEMVAVRWQRDNLMKWHDFLPNWMIFEFSAQDSDLEQVFIWEK